jgi:hypothetical protein
MQGAAPFGFKGAGFDFVFFLLALPPTEPLTPPPQPSNPQFSPFPAKHLAPRHSHTILSRLRRTQPSPTAFSPSSNFTFYLLSSLDSFKIFPPKIPTLATTTPPLRGTKRKSFSGNTYGSPRKCCKQKSCTISKSFSYNTYRKQGVGPRLSAIRLSALTFRRVYSEAPSGRKYCVPLTGSWRRRSNC